MHDQTQRGNSHNLRWAGSVLDARERGHADGVDMELTRDPIAARAQVFNLRSTAEEALARMDADERWRRCLSDARVPERVDFEPGSQVYFCQRQKSAKPQRGRSVRARDRWIGPAVVFSKDIRKGGMSERSTLRCNCWVAH
eukprot:5946653-Amphidinium_carterae.1